MALRHDTSVELSDSQRRFTVTGVMLGLGVMFGDLVGPARSEIRLEFEWSEPPWGERLEAALECQAGWGAPANALVVPASLLGLRSPLADAALHEVALASFASRRRLGAEGMRAQTERLLAKSESGRLASSAAAAALGLSLRTLVRRLSQEGAQYRDLVDSELRSRAQRFLEAGVLSRSEIAARLGFADSTGFSRACRRWFRGQDS
jgi:AraC-like DNA-binding protein